MASEESDALRHDAEDFLENFLREPGAALGGWLSDTINAHRFRNLTIVVCEARLLLRKQDVSGGVLPLKVIHPLIESASLEDDQELRTCWANMLANAVDPRRLKESSPRFSTILKDLTLRDVKFLRALYDHAARVSPTNRIIDAAFGYEQLMSVYGQAGLSRLQPPTEAMASSKSADKNGVSADVRDLYSSVEILLRHVVLHEENEPQPVEIPAFLTNLSPLSGQTQRLLNVILKRQYTFTMTGIAFVQACQPPEK
jgi:hypothetical protein